MMPRMLYDRLDELGIDFGIVYPTAGLGIPRIADGETRRDVIRGFNIVTADYFAKLSDRLTPAAVTRISTSPPAARVAMGLSVDFHFGRSAAQSAGSAPLGGTGNSVITPAVVIRPILVYSVNHSAPSGPAVMPSARKPSR